MNAKNLVAAAALALVGTSAFAIEAVQWNPAPPAPAPAQKVVPKATARVVSYGEFTQFLDRIPAGDRSRSEVLAEARRAPKHYGMKDCPYVGG
ncbi:MAG TPA: hypothetical protein VJ743_09530 [Albitalea sp.]|nr:hypothetical protein [Albitalea sp.]